jgi:hypothetical protein
VGAGAGLLGAVVGCEVPPPAPPEDGGGDCGAGALVGALVGVVERGGVEAVAEPPEADGWCRAVVGTGVALKVAVSGCGLTWRVWWTAGRVAGRAGAGRLAVLWLVSTGSLETGAAAARSDPEGAACGSTLTVRSPPTSATPAREAPAAARRRFLQRAIWRRRAARPSPGATA